MFIAISRKLEKHNVSNSNTEAKNFRHLYWDVVWFGLLFGSTLSFLTVYAVRVGATSWQIGLLTAGPALINVICALPAGRWLKNRSLGSAITRVAILHRLGYLLLIPLPFLFDTSVKIWGLLILIIAMGIPGTVLAVGFNVLLAVTVPVDKRGRVVGWRNALLAGSTVISFLLSGWLLEQFPFEWSYVFVFGLGALGAGMSTFHLSRLQIADNPTFQMHPIADRAQPGRITGFNGGASQRRSIGMRLWLNWRPGQKQKSTVRTISPQYQLALFAFFLFHFSQMLPAALFPLFWINELHLSDGVIGWINALFYLAMLVASPFLETLTNKFGIYRLTAIGAVLLALYPLLTALSWGLPLLIIANLLGGVVWAIMSGTFVNRLLELIPDDNRPPYLALYNIALNIATLTGTMLGPLLSNIVGLREALFIIFAVRLLSGLTLFRWG